MADVHLDDEERTRTFERNDAYRDRYDRAAPVVTSNETRPGVMTTEFWVMLAATVGLVVAGYWDEAALRVNLAYSLAAGIVFGYILSRGIAKAGSTKTRVHDGA